MAGGGDSASVDEGVEGKGRGRTVGRLEVAVEGAGSGGGRRDAAAAAAAVF